MGRILRIGTDLATNYTLFATSGYDANNPPGTTSAWPDSLAMDQSFTQVPFVTVTELGALVEFNRFPDTFLGAMVKIKPTYDTSIGEAPIFEMWTNSDADGWVKRRSIALTNVFVGVPTGTYKVLDLTFFPFLRGITQVWLTLNPGTAGAPTVEFVSIQLYGQCDGSLRNDHGGGPGGACDDPTDPFYTGFDNEGNPCPGTTFGPPTSPDPPTLDVCNAASIANYRVYAQTIPGYVEVFDAWLEANALLISEACAGTGVGGTPSPPSPPGSPPALPPLDLCDPASIDAFRAALAGNPDQVTAFDEYIDGLTAVGFFDLVCAPPEPDEVPIDPVTLAPVNPEPPNPPVPFGSGPGGQPQFPRPGNRPGPARHSGGSDTVEDEYHYLFMPGPFAKDFITSNLGAQPQAIQDAINNSEMRYVLYGGDVSPSITSTPSTAFARLTRINFHFRNMLPGYVIGMLSAGSVQGSVSTAIITPGSFATINSSGFSPDGPGNATFTNETPDFGLVNVVSGGLLNGHYTLLRQTGSGPIDTFSFGVAANDGLISGGDQYVDKFLTASVANIGSVMMPVYAATQTSVFLSGFYLHLVVRRLSTSFRVAVGVSVAADTADHRAAILPGPTCTANGCTIE